MVSSGSCLIAIVGVPIYNQDVIVGCATKLVGLPSDKYHTYGSGVLNILK